ncbi:protein SCO1 homolog, mitochondrial-like [Clavelina lepadiformis]|uniref:Uncharacterized protein n=1 Tax=Clavelina lepadiformis TaxID=159417 RepID=A0ABP0FTH6_CLALP
MMQLLSQRLLRLTIRLSSEKQTLSKHLPCLIRQPLKTFLPEPIQLNKTYFSQTTFIRSNDVAQNRHRDSICRYLVTLPPKRSRNMPKGSPIRWEIVMVLVAVGTVLILLMKHYKSNKEQKLDMDTIRSYGKPLLGGDFELVNQDGEPTGNKDFLGKWILIYFGFTHCPDICPEELEKMGNVVDIVNREDFIPDLLPVFISIDPERDTTEAVKTYISEFHPDMVGLTGTREQVDQASRAFRVYYSAGPKDNDDDYLVDHTVIMYLVDDKGEFCEYFGQTKSAGEIASTITATMVKSLGVNAMK